MSNFELDIVEVLVDGWQVWYDVVDKVEKLEG